MKKIIVSMLMLFLSFGWAQSTGTITGTVVDSETNDPIADAIVKIKGSDKEFITKNDGVFTIDAVAPGNKVLVISAGNYQLLEMPVIVIKAVKTDVGNVLLDPVNEFDGQSIITLSSDDLSDDETSAGNDNIAGILQSSKDTYQRIVAFNFGQVWFKARGYDSNQGEVMFNGIPMNKISNGRPQWSDWGGLNDVLRNQEFTNGLAPSEQRFGGVLGSTNFITRASKMRKGGRVSNAFTNSNYTGRTMVSYNTGMLKNGWALSVLGSRRYGHEGYFEGTTYNAWGGFIAAEKKLNKKHSINFTAFYTPNRRGKNSPNTQEVWDLGGTKYNAYWGWQGPYKRNSRMKEIKEPTFMLGHYWNIDDETSLNTNIMYQSGTIGNSRIDYQGMNPDPTYYQRLPSYYLRHKGFEDYESAYTRTRYFLDDAKESQLMWEDLYAANELANLHNDPAYYLLYEDVNKDKVLAANSVFFKELTDNVTLNASAMYKSVKSENYARIMDMLGADYYVDVNKYALDTEKDNDMNNPNRVVKTGDKFKYDYDIDASIADAFAQLGFTYNKVDFYLAANIGNTSYQRDGKYLNGEYQNTSYGKGEKVNFLTYGTKAGLTYKITGNHLLNFNAGYLTQAPSIRNTYANSRVSNELVPDVTTNKVASFDASYYYRTQSIKMRLTGYYTKFKDLSEVSFYYVQGISGVTKTDDFLTAALYGIEKKNIGMEMGIEAKINPTLKFLGGMAIGQFTYDNNPHLRVSASEEDEATFVSYLKDYKQSVGPQQGYSVGFEYRDPKYWWVSANANLLTNNYVGLSSLRRTDNFYIDPDDGAPINGVTQEEVDKLLAQERLEDIFLVNIVGGKSWKIDKYYFGFFASVNNLLGEKFRTGGFEQSRKGNFANFKEDAQLEHPLFGNKYWYGRGTSYYLNFYVRF